MLRVFDELGDRRERAVTLRDIAHIMVSKGEVDEALKLHQERLRINDKLGSLDGRANSFWAMAQIELKQESYQEAFDHLSESYNLNIKLGRLDGICFVGKTLGMLLCQANQKEQGLEILTRSRDGFKRLGQEHMARQVEDIMKAFD